MPDFFRGTLFVPTRYLSGPNKKEIYEALEKEDFDTDDIADHCDDEGLATFEKDETHNGELEDLEETLVKLKIPFDRHSEGYHDIAPEHVYFRPDQHEKPIVIMLNHDENEVIPAEVIAALFEKGTTERMDGASLCLQLKQTLTEYTAFGIPPLMTYV